MAQRIVVLQTLAPESTIYPPGQVIHPAAWLRVPLREAAALSGLSPRAIYELCLIGVIRARTVRGRWWVHGEGTSQCGLGGLTVPCAVRHVRGTA